MKRLSYTIIALTASVLIPSSLVAQEKKPPKVTYQDHVLPILRAKCLTCHNANRSRGGLDLSSYTALMEGGSSGKVIKPGESSQSYLYALIAHTKKPSMPPKSPKLPDEMIETFRKWIDGGVLETDKSKAILPKKTNLNLALESIPTERPKNPAMPIKLLLEPIVRTKRTTAVTALATSPWSPLAAVAGQKQVLLYNTKTLELVGVLPFPEGTPQVLKFSRNASLLLVGGGRGGASGKVVVFDVKTGKQILKVGDELDTVLAADISSDHRLIALGGPQRMVRIYSTEDGRLIHQLKKHTEWIYSLEFSPDGVLLASADRNGGMFVWEAFTGREYLTLKGHTKAITGVSWRADSNILASCSEDATIRLWEMENGRQVRSWGAHGGGASNLEFARDGRILSCGRDRATKLWDQNGKLLKSYSGFSDIALRVTFCDESNRAIAGDWNGEIRVWDAVKGTQVGSLSSNPPKLAERVTLAQSRLATAQAKQKSLQAAYLNAKAALDKAVATLASAKKTLATSQLQSKALTTKIAGLKKALPTAIAAQTATAKTVSELQGLIPLLTEALTKAQAASAKAKADKEVTAVTAQIQTLVNARNAQLTTTQKTLIQQTAAVKKIQTDLAAAEGQLKTYAQTAANAQKQITALTPTIKPLQTNVATAKKPADAIAAEVTAAQNELSKWQAQVALLKAQAKK